MSIEAYEPFVLNYLQEKLDYLSSQKRPRKAIILQTEKEYKLCAELLNTATYTECKILLLLRQCEFGDTYKFYIRLKKYVEGIQAMHEITNKL